MFFEVGKMEIIHLPGYSNWQSAKHVMCTTAWASDWPMSYFGEPPRYPSIEQFSPWFGTGLQRQLESPQHDTILPLYLHGFTCIYVVLCHAFGPVTFHLCTPSRIFWLPWSRCQIHGDSEYDILMLLCVFPFWMFRWFLLFLPSRSQSRRAAKSQVCSPFHLPAET